MARATDVAVLGSGFRGLWLSTELVKLGWKVTWVQLHEPPSNKREEGFAFDDWPLQVGPFRDNSVLRPLVTDFVGGVIKPKVQEISVQVVTPQGPLELSGGAENLALKKFFPKTETKLKAYFQCIRDSRALEDTKGRKLLSAHTQQIFKLALGDRWILEWLGSLRRSRDITTKDWILNWYRDVLDPGDSLWLLDDGLEDVCARGIPWAQKRGVQIHGASAVADVSVEGRRATGIEITGGEGFLETRFIIVACSHERILKKVPRLGRELASGIRPQTERGVWVRCGFLLRAGTRPEGLLEFSSFVMDPFMPLVEANMGFLKWKIREENDHLTVWMQIPYGDLKRRSYLTALTEKLQKHLEKLFPRFSRGLVAVLPFDEYFHSQDLGHDNLAMVFDQGNKFGLLRSRLQNVWMAGPEQDRGLEMMSALATEYRLLLHMTAIRQKELKKSDRKIHSARNGPDLVRSK